MKRGQVTVFIILGIIILIVTVFGIYFMSFSKPDKVISQDNEPIRLYIENCIEKGTISAMKLTFSQGGFYIVPENSFENIPYYFKDNLVSIPSLEKIEKEIALAFSSPFNECINDFEPFTKTGYSFEKKDYEVQIKLENNKVFTELDFKVKATIGTSTQEFENFISTSNFGFPEKYQDIKSFFEKQRNDPNYFLMSELSGEDYEFGYLQPDDENVIVNLVYENNLIFTFALKFEWDNFYKNNEEVSIGEGYLQINEIEPILITTPGIHKFKIETVGEDITFRTDPSSLKIDSQTGIITINTNQYQNDEYLFYVIIEDSFNQPEVAPFYFDVNVNNGNFPIITSIEKLYAKVGEKFTYQVEAQNPKGDFMVFSSNIPFIEIDKLSGLISFTPDELDIFDVRIDVENEFGSTWEKFEVVVE